MALNPTPVRILMVDDHQVVRAGLRMLLGHLPDLTVIGEAGSCREALEKAQALKPDLVLMDVRLPDGTGFDACRQIRLERPETRVLFLTSFTDDQTVLDCIQSGGDGYLLKEIDAEALLHAIRTVAAGQSILDPLVPRAVLDRLKAPAAPAGLSQLSPQERKVLALVAEGKTNKEIGQELGLAEKTVKNYLSNLLEKLGLARRSQAAAYYAERRPSHPHSGPG